MSMMRTLVILSLAIFAGVAFPGCAYPSKKMDPTAARSIHTIALLDVPVPDHVIYKDQGASQLTDFIGGSIIYAVAMAGPEMELGKALGDRSQVGRLLADELETSLKQKGYAVRRIAAASPSYRAGSASPDWAWRDKSGFVKNYAAIPVGDADAILDVACCMLGYGRYPYTQCDCPVMAVAARLVSSDGKTEHYVQRVMFWECSDPLYDTTCMVGNRQQFNRPWSEIFKNPEVLNAQLRIAAQGVSSRIADGIATK